MKKKPDHALRAELAWPHLVKRAAELNPKPFTYSEISKLIGVHHRAAGYFLGVIQRYCDAHTMPPLQALAVNASTRLPGGGYYGSPRTPKALEAAIKKVAAYPWPAAAPSLASY